MRTAIYGSSLVSIEYENVLPDKNNVCWLSIVRLSDSAKYSKADDASQGLIKSLLRASEPSLSSHVAMQPP